MRTWNIETDEHTSGGRQEVTSDVLASELGVDIETVEAGSVEEVQALVDAAQDGFWEWATRYAEVVEGTARIEEEDPLCVVTMIDRGEVVLATSGRYSRLLRAIGEHARAVAADLRQTAPSSEAVWEGLDVDQASDLDLLQVWGRLGYRGCSVVLEPVVEPRALLRVSRSQGWRVRCWAPTQEVVLTLEEAVTVLGVSRDIVEGSGEAYMDHLLRARRHRPEVQEWIRSTLTPQVTVTSVLGARSAAAG